MTSTTYPEFGGKTESLEVAEKFAEQIQGKTILITGVNLKGVGFATSKAFVSDIHKVLKHQHNRISRHPNLRQLSSLPAVHLPKSEKASTL